MQITPITPNQPYPMSQKTLGELRVRTSFNPSELDTVAELKQTGAKFINLINALPNPLQVGIAVGEFMRLKSLAMTAIEQGTSDAVKAATLRVEDYQ